MEKAVSATLEKLREKHKHHLALKEAGDGYYVYEITVKRDPVVRSRKTFALYIGKIMKDGSLVEPIRKKGFSKNATDLDTYIKEKIRLESDIDKGGLESELEEPILMELSTNPRDGVAAISKRLGLAYSTTAYWIKKLEKKYGIHYTIENRFLSSFGFDKFIAIAKFIDKKPEIDKLKKLVDENPYIQLAFLTRGDYNLFIFLLAPNVSAAESIIYKLRSSSALARYPAHWYSSYYTQGIGYIPIRDKFFDLLKEFVWTRTKEQPRRQKNQILMREYATLRELNKNGLVDFTEIDKKYLLKSGSAQYTYHKLIEEKMIHRITFYMDSPPIKDIAIIIAEQLNIENFNKYKNDYFKEIVKDEAKPVNKYIFEGDIGSPYGLMLITPIYTEGDLEGTEKDLYKSVRGSRIKTSLVSSTLVGNFGIRKIDNTKTWVYQELMKPQNDKNKN